MVKLTNNAYAQLVLERDSLSVDRAGLLAELQNIAEADPSKWVTEMRDQFQQWAQNRARAAIATATGTGA